MFIFGESGTSQFKLFSALIIEYTIGKAFLMTYYGGCTLFLLFIF